MSQMLSVFQDTEMPHDDPARTRTGRTRGPVCRDEAKALTRRGRCVWGGGTEASGQEIAVTWPWTPWPWTLHCHVHGRASWSCPWSCRATVHLPGGHCPSRRLVQ